MVAGRAPACARRAVTARASADAGRPLPVPGGRSCVLPLRIAGKHLNYVIVQAVVKLSLERPWKLLIFNFAGLEQKLVGVHVDTGGLKADLDFDAISRGMRVKIKEGMLVTQQFALDFLEKFVHWGNRRSIRGHTGRGHTRHVGGAKTLPEQQ